MNGKLEIPVTLVKHRKTKGDFNVSLSGLPFSKNAPQVKIKEADSAGKLTVTFKKTNEFAIAPGEFQCVLRGQGTVKYRDNPPAAERAEAERKRIEELEKRFQEESKTARAAVDPARKSVQEAERNLKSASDEAKADLEARLKEAREKLEAAEGAARAAAEKAKRAADEKNRAAQRAKQAADRAKERDVQLVTYSVPFTITVKPEAPKEEGK